MTTIREYFEQSDQPGEPLEIAYRVGEHGWASMHVRLGLSEVEIDRFGYLTDALGDLVRAALAIATGAFAVDVVFEGEPFLWGIVVDDGWRSTQQPPAFRLRVLYDEGLELPSKAISEWSQTELEGRVTGDNFADAVEKAARKVLEELGEDGYLSRWIEYPFPVRALAALQAALALPDIWNHRQ